MLAMSRASFAATLSLTVSLTIVCRPAAAEEPPRNAAATAVSADGAAPVPVGRVRDVQDVRVQTRDGSASIRLGDVVPPGRATIVALWASWCQPCYREAAHLAKLRERYGAETLTILTINIDASDRAEHAMEVDRYLKATAGRFDVYFGDASTYLAFERASDVRLPRLYVFDPDGSLVTRLTRYWGSFSLGAVDRAVAKATARR